MWEITAWMCLWWWSARFCGKGTRTPEIYRYGSIEEETESHGSEIYAMEFGGTNCIFIFVWDGGIG